MKKATSVLVIYTGGTIGMVHQPETGALVPIDFNHISQQVPELKRIGFHIETITFNPVIDSAEVDPSLWVKLVDTIEK